MIAAHSTIRTFDDFLGATANRLRESTTSITELLPFLLAVPESWGLALDELKRADQSKIAAAGAVAAGATVAITKAFASGPLGFVATSVTAGAMVAAVAPKISAALERARSIDAVVERYRVEFAELASERARRSMRDEKWDVMMDGMLGRFAADLAKRAADPASVAGFSEHVAGPSIRPAPSRVLGSR